MKWSNHTIIVQDYPALGEHVVYSTRTQAMVKISQELKETVDHFTDVFYQTKRLHYTDEIRHLYQLGLVVQDEQEDTERLQSFLKQLKYSVGQSLSVEILTTYACNFKCTYCYQESSRAMVKMDQETQNLTLGWIKRRIKRLGYRSLYINYYGGEPLLNPAAIDHVSTEMHNWCQSQRMAFKFGLQTNGYLLTPKLVDRYLPLGLLHARISIDGLKAVHDRNRPLRGGGGTFDRVIKNIVDVVDKVKIHVSVTYTDSDVEPFLQLLDYFEDLGILYKLGEILTSPAHATLGPKGNPAAIQNKECQCNYTDRELETTTRRIREAMLAKGLPVKHGMPIATCPLTRENSGLTIDQHGRLYRCNSMLGHPEFAVGDVRNDEFNEQQKEFRDLDVWRQCPQDCTYMPMCSGSCRLMSFLENQNFRVPACKKPYLNKMASEMIKQEYERQMALV